MYLFLCCLLQRQEYTDQRDSSGFSQSPGEFLDRQTSLDQEGIPPVLPASNTLGLHDLPCFKSPKISWIFWGGLFQVFCFVLFCFFGVCGVGGGCLHFNMCAHRAMLIWGKSSVLSREQLEIWNALKAIKLTYKRKRIRKSLCPQTFQKVSLAKFQNR